MIKNLLMTAAVAAMTFSASAETIWEGEQAIDWWGNAVLLPLSNFAGVQEGDQMSISYKLVNPDVEGQFKLQSLNADWSQTFFTSYAVDLPEGAEDYTYPIIEDGTLEFAINTHDLALLTDNTVQKIMLVGDNVTISKITLDATAVVTYNPVIWRGEETLSGWGTFVEIKPQQFKAGDRIGFVFEAGEEGGSFKACCVDADWQWCAMTSYSDYPGYSAEWESVWMGQSGAVAAYINDADAANCVNGLQIGGDGLTLIKVVYFPAGTNTSIYVTGDGDNLGGWDLANALTVEGEFGVHEFTSANLSTFKFSTVETTDWEEFNSCAFSSGQCEIGENNLNVTPADWNNVTPWKGDYNVIVDLCAMTMTLATETPKPVGEKYEIYLRGGMNGWGAEPDYLFSTTDGIVYTLDGVSIEAGTEFKFATNDWSTVDLGGASDMVVDTTYILTPRGGNCTVAESVSDVTIILNLDDNSVELSTKNGIASIAADSADAVYYNLQGVRVANPANGIFVKKQGNNVTKVYLR